MLKILYVNATAELGGTDTDLLETVRALDKTVFCPTVLLPQPGLLDEHYQAMGVAVYYHKLGVIKRSDSRSHQIIGLLTLPLVIWQLWRFIRHHQFDLVYNNSLLLVASGLAARLAGKKAIWHSGEMYTRPKWLRWALYRLVGSLAHRIIVSSEAVRQFFPASIRHRVVTINNGIDLSRFDPHSPVNREAAYVLRREFAIPAESPVIGFVGRFIRWKGAHEFVQACAHAEQHYGLKSAHYVVVGSLLEGYKTYLDEVKAEAAALGIADKIHFATNRRDIPAFLAMFDIFVHASIKPEPFGIVIIEAMAMGKPVIATNAGGVPEIIENPQLGRLVTPCDVPAMAQAMAGLVSDQAACQAMSKAAYQAARDRFEISAVTRRQQAVYLELFGESSGRTTVRPYESDNVGAHGCAPKAVNYSALDVTIVIVNYNGQGKIIGGLASLRNGLEGLRAEIYIVDNASTDTSLTAIKAWLRALPQAERQHYNLIENRHNLGYAKANNQAIQRSRGAFVLLLNPDAEVEPDTIAKTLTFMRQKEQVGICGARILLPNGKLDSPCRRSFKTPEIYLYKFLGLSKLFPRSRRFGRYYLSYLDEQVATEVDAVIGAFLMIRRELIAEIGLLDERYFIYCEDEDWCFQAKKQGWQVYYYPAAIVHHQKGASTAQRKLRMVWEWHKAVFKFHRKNLALHYPLPVNLLIYAGIGLQLGLVMTLNLTKRLLNTFAH